MQLVTSTTSTTPPSACGVGATGAACLLRSFLDAPLCDGESARPRLERFVERRASRALDLLATASASDGRRRGRALRRADRLLQAIQQRARNAMRNGGISERCAERIRGAVTAVRDELVTDYGLRSQRRSLRDRPDRG